MLFLEKTSYIFENEEFREIALRDHLPLQQGLRRYKLQSKPETPLSETIFHYNKD